MTDAVNNVIELEVVRDEALVSKLDEIKKYMLDNAAAMADGSNIRAFALIAIDDEGNGLSTWHADDSFPLMAFTPTMSRILQLSVEEHMMDDIDDRELD